MRRYGKTAFLIEVSAKHRVPIICENEKRAEEVSQIANNMGLDIPFPVLIEDVFKYASNKDEKWQSSL